MAKLTRSRNSPAVYARLVDANGVPITNMGYPEVNTYGDLPAAALYPAKIYIVRTSTGIYIISRREAGLYISNGVTWTRLGDIPSFFSDANFKVYNSIDNTKQVAINAASIATGTIRTLTIQNADGTVAYTADITNALSAELFDNVFRVKDNGDATKQVAFEVSGVTTATTRTLTVPNQNGTIAVITDIKPVRLPMVSAHYYDQGYGVSSGGNIGGGAIVANELRAIPIYVPNNVTVDRMAVEITTATAGTFGRLGIYADSNGVPGALIVDAGQYEQFPTGVREITLSQALTPGWYWMAQNIGTSRSYRRVAIASGVGVGCPTNTTLDICWGVTRALAFGALPNPFGSGSRVGTGTDQPRIMIRVA